MTALKMHNYYCNNHNNKSLFCLKIIECIDLMFTMRRDRRQRRTYHFSCFHSLLFRPNDVIVQNFQYLNCCAIVVNLTYCQSIC